MVLRFHQDTFWREKPLEHYAKNIILKMKILGRLQ